MILKSFGRNLLNFKHKIINVSNKNRAYRQNVEIMKSFQEERKEFNKNYKETRKKITKTYWDDQTKIENDWLDNYVKDIKGKKYRDDARQRNSIIRNSFVCYEGIKNEIDYQQNFRAKQKIWQQENMEDLMRKHSLLSLLDEQSKSWITIENMDKKIDENVNLLIPPSIISHKDYYRRLQKQAVLYDQGKYDEAEEIRLNKDVIDFKNKILINIYRDLKNLIRKVTYTEEHSIYEKYKDYATRVRNSFGVKSAKTKEIVAKLENNYRKILTYTRLENEKPLKKFMGLESQLQSLLSILVGWAQYTEILYLPDDQIETLIAKDSYKVKADDLKNKFQDKDEEEGELKGSKGSEVRLDRLKELMKLRKINEGELFENVNEEDFSENEEEISHKNKEKDSDNVEKDRKSKSSDFDTSKTSEGDVETDEVDEESTEEKENIKTNEELKNFKAKLFSELGLKHDDANEINKLFEKEEEDKKDEQETLTEDGTEIRDPMSNQIIDEVGNKEMSDIFQSEVFENVLKNSKDLFDFKKPKVHFQVDLYTETLIRFFELSRVADESKKDQISIIMNFYLKELNEIDDDKLGPEIAVKKKNLTRLCKLASHYKITDAQNLKKIFDLYRHERILFKLD